VKHQIAAPLMSGGESQNLNEAIETAPFGLLEMSALPTLEKLGIQFEVAILEQESHATWAAQVRDTLNTLSVPGLAGT
jgi:hypothetical protein